MLYIKLTTIVIKELAVTIHKNHKAVHFTISLAFLIFSSSQPLIAIINAAYTKAQTAIKPKNHAILLTQSII
jgi:hypothetical protein